MKVCGGVVLFAEVKVPQFGAVDVAACAAIITSAKLVDLHRSSNILNT